jgi:hypothetical protein
MVGKQRTRSASGNKYAGPSCELPDSDLPTHSDIASYFTFICASEKDYNTQVHLVKDKLIEVWGKCNPRLPLLEKFRVFNKLKIFLSKVKSYDRKAMKQEAKKHLLSSKNKLFDIAACSCPLPIVRCDNPSVKCKTENCSITHILCQCPFESKVPDIEREYLRDQRLKVGTKGQFQMRGTDRTAAAEDRAKHQREEEKKQRITRSQQHMEEIVVIPDIEVTARKFLYCPQINVIVKKNQFF